MSRVRVEANSRFDHRAALADRVRHWFDLDADPTPVDVPRPGRADLAALHA